MQFVEFQGNFKRRKDWLASACAYCTESCSFHCGAENLGKGSSGVVYACSFNGRPAAAKVFVEYVLRDNEKQPTRSEIENVVSTSGKRKRVSAAREQFKWYTQLQSMLLEINYAKIAANASAGPSVFGAVIVVRNNPVIQIGMCLFMERLRPVASYQHDRVLCLLEKVSACKLFCLDLKQDHIMQTETGELRMVDFGSEWCVQECPLLRTPRGDLPPRPMRLAAVRSAMVVVMTAQLALHSLFWFRPEGGTDDRAVLMFDVLWGLWKADRCCWNTARRVFSSEKMEPICNTYYKRSGGEIFDVLAEIFATCEKTHNGQLVSAAGATWQQRHLLSNLSGKTPPTAAQGGSSSSTESSDTDEGSCRDVVSLECY